MQIIIKTSYGEVKGEIDEKKNPITARKIIESLPIEGRVNRWGDEIYFEIPVQIDEENSQEEVEVGDIAYWPPGNALCIFFGRTPVSETEKPKAYSPVNVIGKVGGTSVFKKMKDGDDIFISK